LTVGVPDDVTTLDAVFASADRSLEVIMNCYEPLMTHAWKEEGTQRRFVPEQLEGGALEDLSVGGDGVTWTLRVRRGMRFPGGRSHGRDRARLFERNFSVPARAEDSCPGDRTGRGNRVDPDRRRLRAEVRTERRNPLFARILVLSTRPRSTRRFSRSMRRDLPGPRRGCVRIPRARGPTVDRWTPGVEVELVRNESYWRGPALSSAWS
jgi:hypothetical protein